MAERRQRSRWKEEASRRQSTNAQAVFSSYGSSVLRGLDFCFLYGLKGGISKESPVILTSTLPSSPYSCRSIMRAQSLSLSYTPVLASLTAIINTKLPMVGELLVIRLISQFRRSFRRNDKTVCHSTSLFLAHLVNQRVVTEVLALEILVLLLEKPSDDSIEIAVGFMREVGAFLSEESPKATNSIFDRFRAVLYEGSITKRVQYMIEVLTTVRRDKFKDNPRIPEELDLVEEDDQITHKIGLDDELNVQEGLSECFLIEV